MFLRNASPIMEWGFYTYTLAEGGALIENTVFVASLTEAHEMENAGFRIVSIAYFQPEDRATYCLEKGSFLSRALGSDHLFKILLAQKNGICLFRCQLKQLFQFPYFAESELCTICKIQFCVESTETTANFFPHFSLCHCILANFPFQSICVQIIIPFHLIKILPLYTVISACQDTLC